MRQRWRAAPWRTAIAKRWGVPGCRRGSKYCPARAKAVGDSPDCGLVTPPLDALKTNDLIPYQTLTTQAPVAVMVARSSFQSA